jgi:hypothetical protein
MSGKKIGALAEVLAQCWTTAEHALRNTVRQKFPDRDEEIITELFHSELEAECNRVSGTGAVERAFGTDLRRSLPCVPHTVLSKIARGLIASVHFHPREIERRTGGDFGVVLIRPDVRYAKYSRSEVTINKDYQRGLLCQAKIFRRDSSWGALSPKQRGLLQGRLNYLSLVLYRYSDQNGERRELAPFEWQLTRDMSIDDVVKWLRSDNFPNVRESRQILTELALDQIGTNDREVIAKYIAPPLRPSLEIKIRWPDGADPGGTVHLPYVSSPVRRVVARR